MYYAEPFATLPSEADFAALEQQLESILPALIQVGIVAAVIAGILLLLFYLLLSIAVYTMADRRGIGGAFCAWIPLARWVVAGRIASDIYASRTGRHAIYGTVIAATILIPIVMAIGNLIYDIPAWVMCLSGISAWLCRIVRLFALAEIYRDYSRHWVGLLVFNVMFFWLTPIFMIAVHKHTPESVRRSYSAEHRRAAARVSDTTSAENEPSAPAQTAPEPEPLVTPAPQEPAPAEEPAPGPGLTLDGAPAPDAPADTPAEAPVDVPVDAPVEDANGENP